MKKLILASAAAAVLSLGVGAAQAAEPGTEKYFHERGNFDASMRQRGPAPDLAGWPAYNQQYWASGYEYGPSYGHGRSMGYAPGVGIGYGSW